ncbi:hypothetical protein Tco_0127937 [Tanacetum coccineum]
MLNEIEESKSSISRSSALFHIMWTVFKHKVLAPGMFAIVVKPSLIPLRTIGVSHLNFIGHFKESVETVREIVEEARAVKPLDSSLNYACRYTKLSQELLECVIGTCPKNFNERDNKAPSTPVTRKSKLRCKRFHLGSGSKPRSITKKNRTLPAVVTGLALVLVSGCSITYDGESFKAQNFVGTEALPDGKFEKDQFAQACQLGEKASSSPTEQNLKTQIWKF